MKYKKLENVSTKLRNAIIKEIPTAKTIGYEVKMADKITNKQIFDLLNKHIKESNNRFDSIDKRLSVIESLPTIQKELKERSV